MDTISGFWAGAMALDERFLHGLAGRAGGWSALARTSLADRIALGVDPAAARRWIDTPPLQTRGRAIVIGSPDYPRLLDDEALGPPVLLVEGSVEALHAPAVAVVGTRRCTPYGASCAHRVAQAAVAAGYVVVSGLARGIDTHAHRGCLAAGGRTVAVLGHGLSFTSPSANLPLRDELVRTGGAVVSTFPDDTTAARHTFPIRNRWVAGLARMTLVVEAPEGSGAGITAKAALGLGRELLVLPGPLGAPTWAESARLLLRTEAQPLIALEQLGAPERHHPHTPNQRWVDDLVGGTELGALARQLGVSTLELLERVTVLEMSGSLVRLPGGWGRGAPVP